MKSLKITFIIITVLLFFIELSYSASNIKYYKNRKWNYNQQNYIYSNEIKGSKTPPYYKVTYRNGKIYEVRCELQPATMFKKGPKSNKKYDKYAVENYNNKGNIKSYKLFIGDTLISATKFQYDRKSGRKIKQEHYEGSDLILYYKYRYTKGGRVYKMEGYSPAGQLHGDTFVYNNTGRVTEKIIYEYGIEILKVKYDYHTNGKKKVQKIYSEGKPYGDWYYYTADGKQYRKEHYIDGYLSSYSTYQYNGNKLSKITDYNGIKKQIEKVQTFDNQGRISNLAEYYNGKKISYSTFKYNKDGSRNILTYDADTNKLINERKLDAYGRVVSKKE